MSVKASTSLLLAASLAVGLTAFAAQPGASMGRIPMVFEPVKDGFVAQGPGYVTRAETDGLTISFGNAHRVIRPGVGRSVEALDLASVPPATSQSIRLRFVTDHSVAGVGEAAFTHALNRFIGSDQSKWQRDLTAFGKVRYPAVYPGIDCIFYGKQGRVEYDFEVAPGIDPSKIRLMVEGADAVDIDAQGNLRVRVGQEQFNLDRPEVYQLDDGVKKPVKASFGQIKEVAGKGHAFGFDVAAYDPARTLVIDPVLTFSTYLGGGAFDTVWDVASDAAGNIFVCGNTSSTNFTTFKAAQPSQAGGQFGDAFIAKFSPAGDLMFCSYFGGTQDDVAFGLAIDSFGNPYVTGATSSDDFPTTGALQPHLKGAGDQYFGIRHFDAFVTKFNATGTGLIYSTFLGGSGDDLATAIALDPAGNAYVTGSTMSSNFPVVNAVQSLSLTTNKTAFVSELSADGSHLVFSTYLGGNDTESAQGIAVDTGGNAIVTGWTYSTNFPVAAALQNKRGGTLRLVDAFVTKYAPAGLSLVYSTYLGGSADDRAYRVAADLSGNAYVVGSTLSKDFPLLNAAQTNTYYYSQDGFVTKLSPTGSLVYSTFVGGNGSEILWGVAVDGTGRAYFAGETASLPPFIALTNEVQKPYLNANGDALVGVLSPSGSTFEMLTVLGGALNDRAHAIALAPNGELIVGGDTADASFPVVNPSQSVNDAGSADGFVSRIRLGAAGLNNNFAAAKVVSGGLVIDAENNSLATAETGEPRHAGILATHSLWWSWTAPSAGNYIVSSEGSGINTALAVYTGSTLSGLSVVASNIIAKPGLITSLVNLTNVVAGTTYSIAIDSAGLYAGSVSLLIEPAFPVPTNDTFAKAIILKGSTVSTNGTNLGAGTELFEPRLLGNALGASVWFSWTATNSGPVKVNTAGSNFDTLLGVYTGASLPALLPVAGNDDGAPGLLTSELVFFASANTTYRIRIEGVQGAEGNFNLNIVPSGGAANDKFTNAIVLGGTTANSTGSNVGASTELGEPRIGGIVGGASVWWSWTAPVAGRFLLTTKGSGVDTLLGVYTGPAVYALTMVATNDNDPAGGLTSAVIFNAVSNRNYRFLVDGKAGAMGAITLNLSQLTVPANNAFTNRIVLAGAVATASVNTYGATAETGEPAHGGIPATHSAWFSWTAPTSDLTTISTGGSDFDTVLAVYSGGNNLTTITNVAQNDDYLGHPASQVTFKAIGGKTYLIAVDGAGGTAGQVQLSITQGLVMANPVPVSNGTLLNFNSVSGLSYTVQTSLDLVHWTDIGTVNAASEFSHFLDSQPLDASCYYRLKQNP